MNALLAMGIPTTTDSSGYFLLLPHLWPVFVIPAVCFYTVLGAWVVRKLRGNLNAGEVQGAEQHETSGTLV